MAVIADGVRYPSQLRAAQAIGVSLSALRYALKKGVTTKGHKVEGALDPAPTIHHRIDEPLEPRSMKALLPILCTHRLGAYSGGPA